MSGTSLRNGDGKIAGRIAPDSVLQIDDNILDHLMLPRKPRGALSQSVLDHAFSPVNLPGHSLIDTGAGGDPLCAHSSGTKLGRRGLSQYRFLSSHASRLESARPEVFVLTVFRRDLGTPDISIRSRSPCPAIIFISEPDHPRSRTRSAKCSRMPSQHCSMPSGLPSNWCGAANRQMLRSSWQRVSSSFSKFHYRSRATETATCYSPPNIAGRQFSSLPEWWLDPRRVSSNPLHGERANATRPRSVRAGRNIVARNRRVRRHKHHNNRALGPRAQRQGWALPPSRRQWARRENRDAIERPPSSGSQPHRLRPLRQVRV